MTDPTQKTPSDEFEEVTVELNSGPGPYRVINNTSKAILAAPVIIEALPDAIRVSTVDELSACWMCRGDGKVCVQCKSRVEVCNCAGTPIIQCPTCDGTGARDKYPPSPVRTDDAR